MSLALGTATIQHRHDCCGLWKLREPPRSWETALGCSNPSCGSNSLPSVLLANFLHMTHPTLFRDCDPRHGTRRYISHSELFDTASTHPFFPQRRAREPPNNPFFMTITPISRKKLAMHSQRQQDFFRRLDRALATRYVQEYLGLQRERRSQIAPNDNQIPQLWQPRYVVVYARLGNILTSILGCKCVMTHSRLEYPLFWSCQAYKKTT